MDRAPKQSVDRVDEVFLGRNRPAQIDQRRQLVRPRIDEPTGRRQPAEQLCKDLRQIADGRKRMLVPHVGGQDELQEADPLLPVGDLGIPA